MGATEHGSRRRGSKLPDTSLSLEEVFDVLKDARRRRIVLTISDQPDSPIEVSTLATRLAEYEDGQNCKNRCYVALIQQHLPMLDKIDVVSYDEEEKVVVPQDIVCLSRVLAATKEATTE